MHNTLTPHPDGRPFVMGIVNVTPDSFSDGGRFLSPDAARDHGLRLIEAGADLLDIGGESTRPGADPVGEIEEMDRVLPVIEAIRAARPDIPLSIDTMKPDVAGAAVGAGCWMWNDVNALRSEGAMECAADLGCAVCLMHMQGEPQSMQQAPVYQNVVTEVAQFLGQRAGAAMSAGIAKDRIWLDPGIGFGKTLAHNLALIAALEHLTGFGFGLLFGASRKRFIQAIDETANEGEDRIGGSLAAALEAARAGASIIRVHDVRETVQALKVQAAIAGART